MPPPSSIFWPAASHTRFDCLCEHYYKVRIAITFIDSSNNSRILTFEMDCISSYVINKKLKGCHFLV